MPKFRIRHTFENEWKKRFESFAQGSDDDAGIAGWSSTGLEARLRYFKYIWRISTHNKNIWLDAGCGAGTYSRFLSGEGVEVIGLDYSLPSLQKAVSKESKQSILWCVADVTKLPTKPSIFDGAMCFGVTQALENSSAVVQNLTLTVKCGGQVWVDALNGYCIPNLLVRFFRWMKRRPMHLRYESYREIYTLMENNGLTNIRLYWLPILPAKLSRFQWVVETHFAKWLFRYIPFLGLFFSHAFILCGERKCD